MRRRAPIPPAPAAKIAKAAPANTDTTTGVSGLGPRTISLDDLEKRFGEVGVAGAKVRSGRVFDEYLPQLQGIQGYRAYREMSDSDSTIGTILLAVNNILKAVDWMFSAPHGYEEDPTALEYAQFAHEVFFGDDMEISWNDMLSDNLSFLIYGWSWAEVVYKRRLGPDQTDPSKRSKYSDGRIGIRKIAIRSQETLWQWDIAENGDVHGMWQIPPVTGDIRYIPKAKSLHFRTSPNRGNPEGRSILRNAYRSWYMLKTTEEIELIAAERDLTGLPVFYIPSKILNSVHPKDIELVNKYVEMARDIKFNHQTGLVLESDNFVDEQGNWTDTPRVRFELTSTAGSRTIDTTKIKADYKYDIARTALADFAILGSSSTGSYALAQTKVEFFLGVVAAWADTVADVFNTQEIPRLWKINGLPSEYMPRLRPGTVGPENIEQLTDAIDKLAKAGMPLFPDEKLEAHVRERLGLPEREDGDSDDFVSDVNGEQEE